MTAATTATVLIIYWLGSGTEAIRLPFPDQKACEAAREYVRHQVDSSLVVSSPVVTVCVPEEPPRNEQPADHPLSDR
jgi:hypothetical protein